MLHDDGVRRVEAEAVELEAIAVKIGRLFACVVEHGEARGLDVADLRDTRAQVRGDEVEDDATLVPEAAVQTEADNTAIDVGAPHSTVHSKTRVLPEDGRVDVSRVVEHPPHVVFGQEEREY